MTDKNFEREERYTVIKHTDYKALTKSELEALLVICDKVVAYRQNMGKEPLKCVVVEADWPEYGPTWEAIGKRPVKLPMSNGLYYVPDANNDPY